MGDTLTETAYGLLHRDILTGKLAPDTKLGVRVLVETYGIGPTPIREALSRISEMGLVRARGRHGFVVASLGRADLADLVWLRRTVEAEALRRAMQQGGREWEAQIVASLHVLRRAAADIIQSDNPDAALDLDFDAVHKRFHHALLAACGSDRLMMLAARLYDQTFRYRKLAMRSKRWTQDVIQQHERLAELILARSPEGASALDVHIADVLAMAFPDG